MRKILIPVITLVSLILLGIAFGLGSLEAASNAAGNSIGNYYSLVWLKTSAGRNALNIVGFFMLCVGTLGTLVFLLPIKGRKFAFICLGALLIVSGVFALLMPSNLAKAFEITAKAEGGLIAMAVLEFVAGGLLLLNSALEFTAKE